MLTYLFLSNCTEANGDHSYRVPRHFEEFTSHQLDLRRPTVHANLALKKRTKRTCDAGAPIVRCLLRNPASQHTCFTSSPNSSAAATPTEWQRAPATRVTLLQPGKECERDEKCQTHNMRLPASPNHSTQSKKRMRTTH